MFIDFNKVLFHKSFLSWTLKTCKLTIKRFNQIIHSFESKLYGTLHSITGVVMDVDDQTNRQIDTFQG